MKMRKVLSLLLVAAMMLGLLSACKGEEAPASTGTNAAPTIGGETMATNPPATDPAPVVAPKLTSITIDGGYSIQFSPDVNEYTVTIPAGRPRIPQISATAETGASVELIQATIADNETSGVAMASAVLSGVRTDYKVTFVRDKAAGFQLQYADQYTYTPAYTLQAGESFIFKSSDNATVSVTKAGVMTAKKVSATPVTISATVGGNVVEELVIDQVIKAPLNVFLIIGQSNAFGWHDVPAGYNDYYAFANTQKALSDNPAPGTVWCDDVANGYDEYTFSGMYDLSKGRSGFSPALGKYWYELTGEKTLMLQTAIGSTPIETWVRDPNLKFYGIDCYAMTVERFNYYKNMLTAADSNYEMNRIYAFWLQGESCQEYVYSSDTFTWAFKHNIPNYSYIGDWLPVTGPGQTMTTQEYHDYFISMYNAFVEDVGLEFIGILPTRAMMSVSCRENRNDQVLADLVAPRAAQFALNYMENGNISVVTMKTDIGRTETYPDPTVEGWGYMGVANIHYNQKGYNVLGKDAAENTFNMFNAEADRTATYIDIIDKNGRTRYNDGDEIKISVGENYQITAMAMPLYTDASELTFQVADTSVCTIDQFGMISVPNVASVSGKTTTLTVSNGEISKTVTIRIAR